MEISGSSGINPIASPAYAHYLTPAEVLDRRRQEDEAEAEAEASLENYYSRWEADGFPGQRIDLLA